jgi:hypothetical protein
MVGPYVPWFSVGKGVEDEFRALRGAERAFVRVLRERAVTWPCEPDDTLVLRPEETGFAHLLAVLYAVPPGSDAVSHVFGAFFDGQGVLGTEVHDQMLIPLPRRPAGRGLARSVCGTRRGLVRTQTVGMLGHRLPRPFGARDGDDAAARRRWPRKVAPRAVWERLVWWRAPWQVVREPLCS